MEVKKYVKDKWVKWFGTSFEEIKRNGEKTIGHVDLNVDGNVTVHNLEEMYYVTVSKNDIVLEESIDTNVEHKEDVFINSLALQFLSTPNIRRKLLFFKLRLTSYLLNESFEAQLNNIILSTICIPNIDDESQCIEADILSQLFIIHFKFAFGYKRLYNEINSKLIDDMPLMLSTDIETYGSILTNFKLKRKAFTDKGSYVIVKTKDLAAFGLVNKDLPNNYEYTHLYMKE